MSSYGAACSLSGLKMLSVTPSMDFESRKSCKKQHKNSHSEELKSKKKRNCEINSDVSFCTRGKKVFESFGIVLVGKWKLFLLFATKRIFFHFLISFRLSDLKKKVFSLKAKKWEIEESVMHSCRSFIH